MVGWFGFLFGLVVLWALWCLFWFGFEFFGVLFCGKELCPTPGDWSSFGSCVWDLCESIAKIRTCNRKRAFVQQRKRPENLIISAFRNLFCQCNCCLLHRLITLSLHLYYLLIQRPWTISLTPGVGQKRLCQAPCLFCQQLLDLLSC